VERSLPFCITVHSTASGWVAFAHLCESQLQRVFKSAIILTTRQLPDDLLDPGVMIGHDTTVFKSAMAGPLVN
jgi:hypothetical protein